MIYIVLYGLNKIRVLKNKIRGDVEEVEKVVSKDFNHIRQEAEKSIKLLEQTNLERKLTPEETMIIEDLKTNLAKSEKDIASKLDDIKKDVEETIKKKV